MPIFRKDEMEATPDVVRPHIKMIQYAGDLLKVGIVTYKKGDVPPPHYHPNDEQWIYILSGKLAVLLGDETTTADAGDLIFIPRNTVHGIRLLDDECTFFACKNKSGTGGLSEDYTDVTNLDELIEKLEMQE